MSDVEGSPGCRGSTASPTGGGDGHTKRAPSPTPLTGTGRDRAAVRIPSAGPDAPAAPGAVGSGQNGDSRVRGGANSTDGCAASAARTPSVSFAADADAGGSNTHPASSSRRTGSSTRSRYASAMSLEAYSDCESICSCCTPGKEPSARRRAPRSTGDRSTQLFRRMTACTKMDGVFMMKPCRRSTVHSRMLRTWRPPRQAGRCGGDVGVVACCPRH